MFDGVCVFVTDGVGVDVSVSVGVLDGVFVGVSVGVFDGVVVGDTDGVGVGVSDSVGVLVGVSLGVFDGVCARTESIICCSMFIGGSPRLIRQGRPCDRSSPDRFRLGGFHDVKQPVFVYTYKRTKCPCQLGGC